MDTGGKWIVEKLVYEPQPQQIDYESVLDNCDQSDKRPWVG